jgi:CHASE3 domain sensor protein
MPPLRRLRLRPRPFATLRRKILAAFASAALVLVVGAVSLLGVQSLRSAYSWVVHTYDVLGAADDVLLALTNAETGQRGYLLTGRDRYLDVYLSGKSAVETDLHNLRQLTADNPEAQRRIDSLTVLAHAKLAELERTVSLRRNQGSDAALAVVLTDEGRVLMSAARSVIAEIKGTEMRLLAQRNRTRERYAFATLVIIVAGSLAAFALAVGTIETIRVDVVQREQDRQQIVTQALQVQEQATALELQQTELEAQTDELRASNEELQAANGRAERALRIGRLAHARLKRSNEELDQFAYVASHDLKAPLRGIANLTAWLEEDLGPAVPQSARDHMALLQGRVRRM